LYVHICTDIYNQIYVYKYIHINVFIFAYLYISQQPQHYAEGEGGGVTSTSVVNTVLQDGTALQTAPLQNAPLILGDGTIAREGGGGIGVALVPTPPLGEANWGNWLDRYVYVYVRVCTWVCAGEKVCVRVCVWCVYSGCVCLRLCMCLHCRQKMRKDVIGWIGTCVREYVHEFVCNGACVYDCVCV